MFRMQSNANIAAKSALAEKRVQTFSIKIMIDFLCIAKQIIHSPAGLFIHSFLALVDYVKLTSDLMLFCRSFAIRFRFTVDISNFWCARV